MPEKSSNGHVPALDGVRGLAIILVILYHAARGLVWGGPFEGLLERLVDAGWIGVDLFFVLSGFLITGILLDTRGGPAYFSRFYARRVLRIFPLYLTVVALLVVVVPATALATPEQAAQLHGTRAWYWMYAVNLLIARWGWTSAAWHSGHLWSLSVEEQFYLLWPLMVFLLSRRALIRTAIGIVIGVSLLRIALVAVQASSDAIYVLLPTRMDGLAIGALLAALAREPNGWQPIRRWTAPALGVAALTLALIFHRESLLYQGTLTKTLGYPSLAVLAAGAIVTATTASPTSSIAGRFWNDRVLRFFGRYSYGLYAWHPFAIALFRQQVLSAERLPVLHGSHIPGNLLFTALAFALSVAVALVSWHVVEQPFLKLKRLAPYESPRSNVAAAIRIDQKVA